MKAYQKHLSEDRNKSQNGSEQSTEVTDDANAVEVLTGNGNHMENEMDHEME